MRLPKSDQTAVKVFLKNTKKIILFGTTLKIANNLMLVMVSERDTKRNTQGVFNVLGSFDENGSKRWPATKALWRLLALISI